MTALMSGSPNSMPGWAEPLHATLPTPGRETLGWRLGNIAVELGTPLMAWQQFVADVGLEIDPATGRLAYKEVIVSVMRQNGKTTLVLAAECARCVLWGSEQRVAYTAQTGKDARAKFKDDHLPLIQKSALSGFVKRPYLSDGNTSLLWGSGGCPPSRISVLDNTPSAGHGKTLDLAIIDEAFADQDNAREQALLPTMATRQDPQIWNTSTAGTPASTYLFRKVELGRAAVAAGKTSGVAYFEWAVPDDEDVDDPAIWAKRMPAFGVTIREDYIRHARQTMTDGDFRRAIGNQWTETEERLIPSEWWAAVSRPGVSVGNQFVVGVDARADRSLSAVVKADGRGNVEVVAERAGTTWVVDELVNHYDQDTKVVLDRTGPLAILADDLKRADMRVVPLDSLDVRKACGRFFDGIADRKMSVRSDDRLDTAVANAIRKTTADAWAWHRDAIGSELLMAASLAYATAYNDEEREPFFAWS